MDDRTTTPAAATAAAVVAAAAAPLLLNTFERNAHGPTSTRYQQYRHARFWKERKAVFEALVRIGKGEKVLARFKDCGAGAWIQVHEDHAHVLKISASKCRNRFCPACQAERGRIVKGNLEFLSLKAGRNLSLITLTLAHHKTNGLRAQVDRLTTAFRELRRMVLWKKAVKGAAWVLEVKRGTDGKWHPHIHVLAEASYLEQGRLSSAWHAVTGDSHITDIRRISANNGAAYVAKYVSKPIHESIVANASDLQEFMCAMHGKRTCAALGSWRHCPLAERAEDEIELDGIIDMSPKKFRSLMPFEECLTRMWEGDQYAIDTLKLLGFEVPQDIHEFRNPPPS